MSEAVKTATSILHLADDLITEIEALEEEIRDLKTGLEEHRSDLYETSRALDAAIAERDCALAQVDEMRDE